MVENITVGGTKWEQGGRRHLQIYLTKISQVYACISIITSKVYVLTLQQKDRDNEWKKKIGIFVSYSKI